MTKKQNREADSLSVPNPANLSFHRQEYRGSPCHEGVMVDGIGPEGEGHGDQEGSSADTNEQLP